MQYQLHFNLPQIAALSAAISFWEKKETKDKVTEFLSHCNKLIDDKTKNNWHKLIKNILNEWNKEILPLHLEVELTHIIKEIGEKIYYWYRYIENVRVFQLGEKNVIDYTDKIYWTRHGTVDEIKVFKSVWLKNPNLSAARLYTIACQYTLKEDIDYLWQKLLKDMPDNCDNRSFELRHRCIRAYWKYCRNGDTSDLNSHFSPSGSEFGQMTPFYYSQFNFNRSTEENMFRLSVFQGDYLATKYFWEKLNQEERNRNILYNARIAVMQYGYWSDDKFEGEKYIQICMFLMNQMTIDHKKIFFDKDSIWDTEINFCYEKCDRNSQILKMLLSTWPWQEFLIPVLDEMLQYQKHDSELAWEILQESTNKIFEDHNLGYAVENSKYRSILHAAWRRIPKSIKHKKGYNIKNLSNIICNLLDIWDLDSIKLILNDPEIIDVKDQWIESGNKKYRLLIIRDQYELLEQFMKEIFKSEEEKKCFKQKIHVLNHFIINYDFHQIDKLLDWQHRTLEEKQSVKNSIDAIEICEFFIKTIQYDEVDKFLNWRFETQEERRKTKIILKMKNL